MEGGPGINRDKIRKDIEEVRKSIDEIVALELDEKYPQLGNRKNYTGLPGEQYMAWQKLQALRILQEELKMLEKQEEEKEIDNTFEPGN